MPKSNLSLLERFFKYVHKSDDPNGCWSWHGAMSSNGYGLFWNGERYESTHRFSYRQFVGEIPYGLLVCHHCDTKHCVNPEHLYAGTSNDNSRDAVARGRTPRGERHSSVTHPEKVKRGEQHGMAILTEEQVMEIRRRYVRRKVTLKQLGAEYGVNYGTIWLIVTNKKWKHLKVQ